MNDDDYARYVLNETDTDYNNIIPQYIESDVNNFMPNFSNESILPVNPSEYLTNYSSNSNANYALTNLDVNTQNYTNANSVIILDSAVDENVCNETQLERQLCNSILNNIPCSSNSQNMMNIYDSIRVSESYQNTHTNSNLNITTNCDFPWDDSNHLFSGKFMPAKALDNSDYMIVSSEEIIDTPDVILDLTNDEVEQILDDSLISAHDLDPFNASRHSFTPCNRLPRINVVANLTKYPDQMMGEDLMSDKTIDTRPLETPIINLESIEGCETPEAVETISLTVALPAKKKSGRTKGARQISK